MRNAMNEVLRTSYVRDCELGLKRWNRQLERAGISITAVAAFVRAFVARSACGARPLRSGRQRSSTPPSFRARQDEWLPSDVRPHLRAAA